MIAPRVACSALIGCRAAIVAEDPTPSIRGEPWLFEIDGAWLSGLAARADGSVLVAGNTEGTLRLGQTRVASPSGEPFVATLDTEGQLGDVLHAGATAQSSDGAITTCADGSYVLSTPAMGPSTPFGQVTLAPNEHARIVTKVDRQSNVLWSKAVGAADRRVMSAKVATDSGGRIHVASSDSSPSSVFDHSLSYFTFAGDGELLSGRNFPGPADADIFDLAVFSDDSAELVGSFIASIAIDGLELMALGFGTTNLFRARFDPTGRLTQLAGIDVTGRVQSAQIAARPDGGTVLCMSYHGNARIENEWIDAGLNGSMLVMVYDPSGNLDWRKQIRGSIDCGCLLVGPSGEIAVGGDLFEVAQLHVFAFGAASVFSSYALRFDMHGNLLSSHVFPSTGGTSLAALGWLDDTRLVLAGNQLDGTTDFGGTLVRSSSFVWTVD